MKCFHMPTGMLCSLSIGKKIGIAFPQYYILKECLIIKVPVCNTGQPSTTGQKCCFPDSDSEIYTEVEEGKITKKYLKKNKIKGLIPLGSRSYKV